MARTYTIAEIQNKLMPVLEAYGIHSATVFGSIAKGKATEHSDLDLLVDSGLKGLRFVGFVEAVRSALLLPVDVLDVRHIEKNSKIEDEIRKTGVRIYEK